MNALSGRRGILAGAAIVLTSELLAFGTLSAQADGGRHAAFMIDANSGRVLHAQSADVSRYPASLTKMMTLYMVFELIEAGKLDANTSIKISAQAAAVPPSKLDLDPGDTIPLGAAIRALVTKSANDIAVAIAEHISGTEAAFARAMTAKARQLGMRSTTFRNAHGLPDAEQVTTARDMATLALALYDHYPRQAQVFATRRFTYAGASYRNHNTLLGTFAGMEGIKTGYTRSSGFNLVASVRRDGRHVVAAVFGGSTAASRNAEMRTLLSRGLARAGTTKSRRPLLLARAEPSAPAGRAPARSASAPMVSSAAAAPARSAPRLVEPIAPATEPARTDPPIQMARVRPVSVVAAPAPAQSRAETFESAPAQYVAPWKQLPSMATPTTPVQQEPVLREPPRPAYASPDTGRGARPSTLSAQASRIEQGEPAVYAAAQIPSPYAERPSYAGAPMPEAPAAAAPIPRGGDYAIQVGAFATAAEAEARLRQIRQSAQSVLAQAADHTEPVTQGSRTLYRARFADLEAASATQACNALRRQHVDCFVARLR
jgi:D-alanyl-D-alanine carboxypeptidase